MIILIPPSEGKNEGGTGEAISKFNVNPVTSKLLSEIKNADPAKLYGLKEKALEEAILTNSRVLTAPTMPAIERYKGVVYQGIDYETLKNKDYFNNHVRIVSGLFGLIKPSDMIPNYRLKIDKLNADKLWLKENSKTLQDEFIVDLLPRAHQKAVSYKNGVFVDFVVEKNKKRMPAGHNGKLIKGRFIRWLVENKISGVDKFKDFKEDGFNWNGEFFLKVYK